VIRRNPKRDAALLAALVLAHELLRHTLAGDAIVSSLFAPGGAHAKWTLFVGIGFVALRVVLFVGVPGVLAGELVRAAYERVLERRE
jgi:hypothetical protein